MPSPVERTGRLAKAQGRAIDEQAGLASLMISGSGKKEAEKRVYQRQTIRDRSKIIDPVAVPHP
jgi:hypothetical protein